MSGHGIKHAIKHGLIHSVKHNGTPYGFTPVPGVTLDALARKHVPANATEWTTMMTASGIGSGNPFALHLLQDASGNPADAIGAFPLTASGTGLGYNGAVAGWTRTGVTMTDAGTGQLFTSAAGLADPTTTSYLGLVYAVASAIPAASRWFVTTANNQHARLMAVSGKLNGMSGVNTVDSALSIINIVEPVVIRVNVTTTTTTITGLNDKLVPTYTAPSAGKLMGLGGTSGPTATYLYAAWFSGAAAELSDAQIRTLLQTLGWTVTW